MLHEQFSSPPGIKQHIVQSEAKTIFQLAGTIDDFRVPLDIAVERLRMKPRQQDILLAVGSFAMLGNVFGIMTVFQLLELANPSQPLLRSLLIGLGAGALAGIGILLLLDRIDDRGMVAGRHEA